MGKVDVAKAAVVSTSPGNEVVDAGAFAAGALKAETAVDVRATTIRAAAAAVVAVFMVLLRLLL